MLIAFCFLFWLHGLHIHIFIQYIYNIYIYIYYITMSQWAVFPLSRVGSAKIGLTFFSTYTVTCNLEHGTFHDIKDPHSQDISILQLLDGSMLRSPGLFYAPCLRRIQAFPNTFKETWEGGAFKVQAHDEQITVA